MRPDRPLALVLVMAGLVTGAAAGCSATASPSTGTASQPTAIPTHGGAASDGPTGGPALGRPSAPPDAGSDGDAWLVVGRAGRAGLQLIRATTGEVEMDLPAGAPRADWGRIASAVVDGAATVVRDDIVQPGLGGPEVRLDGRWRLPTIGLDPIPAGRSLDGSTIALVEDPADRTAGLSRFAIVEHALGGDGQTAGDAPLRLARIVELHGSFEYDTLSPDGRILYVVQHLDAAAGGRYQVRAVDVASGVMRDGVIVDKTNPDERMAGSPIAQERLPGGPVLTLYRGPEHPFVHALMSADGWAICIDLPGIGSTATGDAAATASDWGLARSPDGSSVFAVNASVGHAVEIGVADLAIRRSASIATSAGAAGPGSRATAGGPGALDPIARPDGEPSIVLAKFGHDALGPVGRRVVVSPDGSTLFAAGATGISAIRTGDLSTAGRLLAGVRVETLGLTPDGRTLVALTRDGTIRIVDAATGQDLGSVPGGAFDRLLAVAPW